MVEGIVGALSVIRVGKGSGEGRGPVMGVPCIE